MDAMTLIAATLAVYRLATDIGLTRGPADLYERLRGSLAARHGHDHWLAVGVACPVCLSFWLALPVALTHGPLWWLAVAGGAAYLVRR